MWCAWMAVRWMWRISCGCAGRGCGHRRQKILVWPGVRVAQLRVALIVEVLLVKSLTIFNDQPDFIVTREQLLDKCYRSIQVRPAVWLISGSD